MNITPSKTSLSLIKCKHVTHASSPLPRLDVTKQQQTLAEPHSRRRRRIIQYNSLKFSYSSPTIEDSKSS